MFNSSKQEAYAYPYFFNCLVKIFNSIFINWLVYFDSLFNLFLMQILCTIQNTSAHFRLQLKRSTVVLPSDLLVKQVYVLFIHNLT